jgi:DNA polymerase eta
VGQQSRTKQVPFPFHRPLTPDGLVLKLATRLCGEVLPPEVKPGAKRIKLNNLGLGFSTLERLEEGQRGIEGFFKPGLPPLVASKRKAPAGPPSSDEEDIQVVERKSTHNSFFVKPSVGGSSSSGPPPSEASTSAASSKTASPLRKKAKATPAVAASPPSWTCPQCRKRLPLLVIDDADEDDRGWITAENDRVRMEHEDWHVALSFQEDSPDKKTVPKADAAGSRKVKKKPDDRAKTKAGGKDTRGGGSGASGGGLGDWLTRK